MKFLRIPEYLSEKNPFVKAVPSSKSKPKKSKKKHRDVLKEKDAIQDCSKDNTVNIASGMLDKWANDEEEMQKVYQNELGPEPIPFTIPGHAIDDEDVCHTKKAKAKEVEEVSKQIDRLPDIIQEIAKEDKENKKRHLRCLVATQETESSSATLGKAREIEDSLTYKTGSGLASASTDNGVAGRINSGSWKSKSVFGGW
ncbi:hypothetical protein Q3G72_006012 [Acer saccharum]|nr:hypothetical protein Q3G72_006012 [Acer saccharum]